MRVSHRGRGSLGLARRVAAEDRLDLGGGGFKGDGHVALRDALNPLDGGRDVLVGLEREVARVVLSCRREFDRAEHQRRRRGQQHRRRHEQEEPAVVEEGHEADGDARLLVAQQLEGAIVPFEEFRDVCSGAVGVEGGGSWLCVWASAEVGWVVPGEGLSGSTASGTAAYRPTGTA